MHELRCYTWHSNDASAIKNRIYESSFERQVYFAPPWAFIRRLLLGYNKISRHSETEMLNVWAQDIVRLEDMSDQVGFHKMEINFLDCRRSH